MGRVERPWTEEPFPGSPGLVVLCWPQRLLLRSLGGSCSDGHCPHFLGTHSRSLRACWLMQAVPAGKVGSEAQTPLTRRLVGTQWGAGLAQVTLPSSSPFPLSLESPQLRG